MIRNLSYDFTSYSGAILGGRTPMVQWEYSICVCIVYVCSVGSVIVCLHVLKPYIAEFYQSLLHAFSSGIYQIKVPL